MPANNTNTNTSDWLAGAQLLYQMYNDRNPPKPKFTDTPLSPEQKQLHEMYLKSLMNSDTAGNASYLNNVAKQQMDGLSGMKWTSPKTFSGDVGYSGSNTSFAPSGQGPSATSTPSTSPYSTVPMTPLRVGSGWSIDAPTNATPGQRSEMRRNAFEENKQMQQDMLPAHASIGQPAPGPGIFDDSPWHAFKEQGRQSDLDSEVTPLWRESNSVLGNLTQDQLAAWYGSSPTPTAAKPPSPEESHWWTRLDDAWDRFRAEHPNWARLGQTAVTGILSTLTGAPGTLAGRYLFYKLNKDAAAPPSPATGGDIDPRS